jgi:1-pyrroline-5-carboxylate dehydrogenase
MPCDHGHVLADAHQAGPTHVRRAIEAADRARRDWAAWPWADRLAVFLKAADLLATTWRDRVNAATMLGQAKTAHQSEIDAACELADFWRFNAAYAAEIYAEQPTSPRGVWNQLDYRPLEGFVYAITPFNFTAIAGNLATANVLMGGVSIWKPAASGLLAASVLMDLLETAGLPPGVINFVPGDAQLMTRALLASPELGGVHFTVGRISSRCIPRRMPRRWPWPSCAAGSSIRGRSVRPPVASTCRDHSGPRCGTARLR